MGQQKDTQETIRAKIVETLKAKFGEDYFQKLGKKGGAATKRKGLEHYQAIGKKGGIARAEKARMDR
jgi:hypothetical protein